EILDSLDLFQNTRKFTFQEALEQYEKEKEDLDAKSRKERAHFRAEIFQQRRLKRKFTFWLIISVIVLAFILMAYRIKIRANRSLTKLNLEINQHHQQIKNQKEDLEKLIHSKDRFYSIISHDLRGPVQSLSSLSTILNRSLEEEDIQEMKTLLPLIEDTSRHIAQLLDNLLTWAHQQQGLIQTKPEHLSLNDCVKEVFALYQMEAQVKKIELILKCTSVLKAWADRNGVLSILRNLIGNAIKFSQEGGQVRVFLRLEDHQSIIEVEDSGVGMSEDKLFKILHNREPHSTQGTHGERGSGLGLLLVQDFVKMNQGSLEAKSNVGKGTCFQIYLPTDKPVEVKSASSPDLD
ncbi:MAG: HAMP domain-containing sensor histidine kinase, partial [Bacteroidota bacterium]